MNDKTAAVLQTLAEKLGTTGDYLWGVLLKQAPIFVAVNVMELLITIALTVAYAKSLPWAKRLTDDDDYDILAGAYLIIAGVVVTFCIIGSLASIGQVVTALLNPEYWALEKVLKLVKSK